MINLKIKNILEKCNEAYSNGDLYTLTDEDIKNIEEVLNLSVSQADVTDEIYDTIYYTAKSQYQNDPFFNKLTSNNNGYGEEITHTIPMGSMDELKTGDWDKWKIGHDKYILSDKLDGCSIILTYKNGNLYTAATRGRGLKGKDIMRHVNIINNIPKKINYMEELIVRGELIFKKDDIKTIINKISETTGKIYKNGRNTIAGLLNSKDVSYDLVGVHFVTYWTSKELGNSFNLLSSLGFEIPYIHELYVKSEDTEGNITTLTEDFLINCVKTRLNESEYELDGIILTQLDNVEEGFETGTINPKASRKFKIGIYDNIAESIVTNIKWQISKFGKFTPVIEIEPREVSGCTVTNITGHNYKNLLEKQCGIGSKIKFCRAGLVIPYLMQVLTPSSNINLPNVKTKISGVDLILDDWEINEYSNEVNIQDMIYFGKKLEIDQMGYGNCKKLFDTCLKDNLVLNGFTLLGLPEGLISDILGKNGKKLEDSLNTKKNNLTEVQLASALSIFGEGIGERILQPIYDKYNTLEVNAEQLEALDGFGDTRIDQYIYHVQDWIDIKELFTRMNLKFKTNTSSSTKLKNYVVCFSGIRDKDFAKYIIENGGVALDSWRSDVTHLVVKDKNGTSSKITKALKNGIPIITIEEAYTLFKD